MCACCSSVNISAEVAQLANIYNVTSQTKATIIPLQTSSHLDIRQNLSGTWMTQAYGHHCYWRFAQVYERKHIISQGQTFRAASRIKTLSLHAKSSGRIGVANAYSNKRQPTLHIYGPNVGITWKHATFGHFIRRVVSAGETPFIIRNFVDRTVLGSFIEPSRTEPYMKGQSIRTKLPQYCYLQHL